MAAMTMVTPNGCKVRTRAKWVYAVVVEVLLESGWAAVKAKSTDNLDVARREAAKVNSLGVQTKRAYIFNTVRQMRVL